MKFHLNSFNGCQLKEQTRNSIANDQREITPKISKAEIWFLCITHCLIVLYNCMKFHFYSFNGCQLSVNVFIQESNIRNTYKHTLHSERI